MQQWVIRFDSKNFVETVKIECFKGAVTVMSLMTGAVRYKFLPCEDCWKTRLDSNSSLNNGTIGDEFSDVLPIDIGSSVALLVGIFLVTQ